MLDIGKIRADFPLLHKQFNGKPVVYFDNACMSLKPRQVIEAITNYYTDYSACAGRSNHRLAAAVNEEVEKAREQVRGFINSKHSQEIIFTRNTTEGINLVANTLGLKAGDTILISGKEHNSNLVPWLKLVKTKGIKLTIIRQNEDNTWNMEEFEKEIEIETPKLVAIGQTSNLDGVTFPLKDIVARAHRAEALVLIDAAQSMPHQEINVRDLGVDFLAFSGHKMLGPTGTGVLYGKKDLLEQLDSFIVGGDTVASTTYTNYEHLPIPEKFEAGLQDYAGIMGLGAAIGYLRKLDRKAIQDHEYKLNQIITNGLKEERQVKIIGPTDPELRGSIFSFYVEGAEPHQIALLLDKTYGIMVRSGQHCVHSWFNAKNIKGSVRASFNLYNTPEEAEYFVQSLRQILAII